MGERFCAGYKIGPTLGSGVQGKVKLGITKEGSKVALKFIDANKIAMFPSEKANLEREVRCSGDVVDAMGASYNFTICFCRSRHCKRLAAIQMWCALRSTLDPLITPRPGSGNPFHESLLFLSWLRVVSDIVQQPPSTTFNIRTCIAAMLQENYLII